MKTLKYLLSVCAVAFSFSAFGAVSPLSVGILPPVQFPPDDFTITGARLSLLWGNHRNVYGIDLGAIGNVTQLEFVGVAISGVFNITHGQTTAIGTQLAGVANYNSQKTNVYGFQLAGILNDNEAESSVNGLQAALIANLADHTVIRGLQVGLYNRAQDVYGLQIGLVNVADSLHGVQIGLINFNHKGTFAVSPILNVGF